MIVTAIQLWANSALQASFSVDRADLTQPYIITAAAGLDVDELKPIYYGSGTFSAQKFYNLKPKPRDIALKVKLNPQLNLGQTSSSLRDALYRAISSARDSTVQLKFVAGLTPVATINGFITKFEAPLFTNSPEVQLTINCDYPMLRSPNRNVINGLAKTTAIVADSNSTAPHGFRMQLTFTAALTAFQIAVPGSDWTFNINTSFAIGDVLYFSSEEDNKYLYRIRSGALTHLTDQLAIPAIWPLMFPGNNSFAFTSQSFNFNDFSYYDTYWGV
jgi:hypothetical protein